MMQIRMKMPIGGMFHGYNDVQKGQIVNVDDVNGARYCAQGYAEPVAATPPVETATREIPVETAKLEAPPAPSVEEPKVLDDEEEESEDSVKELTESDDSVKPKRPVPNARRR